jgi:hypothetical protein
MLVLSAFIYPKPAVARVRALLQQQVEIYENLNWQQVANQIASSKNSGLRTVCVSTWNSVPLPGFIDYDEPWMHHHRFIRKLEEKIHVDFLGLSDCPKVKRENFDVVISMSEECGPFGTHAGSSSSIPMLIGAMSKIGSS